MNPAQAGIKLLPLLCGLAVGSFLGGAVSSRRNLTFYTFMAGGSLILLGDGLLSTLSSETQIQHQTYAYEIIVGLGVGITFSTVSLLTTLQVTPDFLGKHKYT